MQLVEGVYETITVAIILIRETYLLLPPPPQESSYLDNNRNVEIKFSTNPLAIESRHHCYFIIPADKWSCNVKI